MSPVGDHATEVTALLLGWLWCSSCPLGSQICTHKQ
jgi:hypothetical protein